MKRALLAGLTTLAVASTSHATFDFLGPGQYPTFRTLSTLVGGGFGVRPNGDPRFDGAMAFSTPIGYNLSNYHIAGVLSNTSDYGWFRFPHVYHTGGPVDSIGKAVAMGGVPLGKFGSLSGSITLVSSDADTSFSLQYGLPYQYKGIGASIGVQDVGGTRGDRAEGNGPRLQSRTVFGAITAPLPYGMYLTAGYGDRRFGKGFGSLSAPLATRFKAVLEHDGYNFNEMVAWDARFFGKAEAHGRPISSTVSVGFVQSRYAFGSFNISF